MEHGNEFSASLGFASESLLSDVSSSYDIPSPTSFEAGTSSKYSRLNKLSICLEKLVIDSEYDYSDAEIEVEGIIVGVNRGILAAQSQFFHVLFRNPSDSAVKSDRPNYHMSDLVPNGGIGHEALMVILHFLYTGKIKDFPVGVSTCVDESCVHDACGPAIDCAVQMMYVSVKFQIKDLVMVVQGRLLYFVNKACVEDVIPILVAAYNCGLQQLLALCVRRISQSNLDNIAMKKELPHEVLADIKSLRIESRQEGPHYSIQENSMNEKNVQNIHKALDTGDIELVQLLLGESEVTLDEACALHYAAAYCSPQTVIALLNLKKADINLRNSRGYTVLHIAARRRDPYIVIELLKHDASVSDTTLSGQTPLTICRRLTRLKDFTKEKKQGLNTNKDRLCIEMLERKMLSNRPAWNVLTSAIIAAHNLHKDLCIFENRVAMARLLFPSEAKLAMQVAEAGSTMEFIGFLTSEDSDENLVKVVFGGMTSELFERRKQRLQALQRTVATGRCYFPNCSEVLDRLFDDETIGTLFLDIGSPEEQRLKRVRLMEIKEDVRKALVKDKAERKRARDVSSCSTASSSPKDGAIRKVGKK